MTQPVSNHFLEKRYSGEHPLRTLLALLGNDRKKLFFAAIFEIIKHSPVWVMPLLTASVIDLLSKPPADLFAQLMIRMGLMVFVIVQNIPNQIIFIRFLSTTARNLEMNLRSSVVVRLQQLSINFLKSQSTGVLHTKLMRDVETIQQLLMGVFESFLMAFASITVALITTTVRAPAFLLVYVLIVPVSVVLMKNLRQPIQDRNTEFRHEVEGMSARLMEMTNLIPVTRAHGLEEQEISQVTRRLEQVRNAGIRLDSINAVFGSTAFVVFMLCNLLVLGTAAWIYARQWIPLTLGDVILLTGYFNSLTSAVLSLLNLLPQVTRGLDAVRSVGEILECEDIEQNQGKQVVQAVSGKIDFEQVHFSYPGTHEAAIYDFDLQVKPGETIAIVGPSGAGKTTILNLVIGFLRPDSGRILLDGRDMAELDLRTYRRFLSVVPQETLLFDGSIRENVTYGAGPISETMLSQALRDANAEEFVRDLPDGWDTVIGERGARLSGGQKQRLAIARALIRNPRVLILDEATSALDTISEGLIQSALARLMQGRTTFVVAHRLSTIRAASRIIVMKDGRIVETGTHEDLLSAGGGEYSRLQTIQNIYS